MSHNLKEYRQKVENILKPKVWWSIWTLGVLYFLYMLIFNVILLLRNNYGLPADIALADMYSGRLIFLAINIPLTSFTCLFTGHLTLALYKTNKLKGLAKAQS